SAASSRSADLSLSLVSRLRRRLPTDGSTLFRRTWRRKATPSGRWLWEHTASALPTSGSASIGEASWGTPCARGDNHHTSQRGREGDTGWLSDQVRLAGWPTPITRDAVYKAEHVKGDRMDSLIRCAVGSGTGATGSPAATEKRGQLNPEHCRWLMGFPPGWSCSGATATRSCRRSRRRSSMR